MPGLTPEDEAALSDDEKALLADFESHAHPEEPSGEQAEAEAEAEQAPPGVLDPEPEPAPEPDEWVDIETLRIGDRDVPIEDVQALLEFQEWANANQEKMQAFGQYLNGQAEFVIREQQAAAEQQQQAAQPDVDWSLVDPGVKAVYDQQQAQLEQVRAEMQQLQNPIAAWQQQQAQQAQREANEQIKVATERVNEKFGLELTPEEIEELHTTTANLGILPSLRQRIADPTEAVAMALETAVWGTEKFRTKIVDRQVTASAANAKKELAGRVGGTSGSDRRGVSSSPEPTDVKKMSREERQAAMAAEIAESLRGTP